MKKVFIPALAVLDAAVKDLEEAGRMLLGQMAMKVNSEDLVTTFIGGGVSILHARDWVEVPVMGFMRPAQPIQEDGAMVEYVFLVVSPKEDPDAHLIALARIARLMTDGPARENLMKTRSTQEALELLERYSG